MNALEEQLQLLRDALPILLDLAAYHVQEAAVYRLADPSQLVAHEVFYTNLRFELRELSSKINAANVDVSTEVALREPLRKVLDVLESRVKPHRDFRFLIEQQRANSLPYESLENIINLRSRRKRHRDCLIDRLKQLNRALVSASAEIRRRPPGSPISVISAIKSRHICRVRSDARSLYEVLNGRWRCDIQEDHTAMVRLDAHFRETGGTRFNLFLETHNPHPAWQESEVYLRSVTTPSHRRLVDDVCSLVQKLVSSHPCQLKLHIQQGCLWNDLNLGDSNLGRGNQSPERLKDLIENRSLPLVKRPTPRDKRRLQVLLANSFLYFYRSVWAGSNWAKEHIYFCRTEQSGLLDINRPYLSASCGNIGNDQNVTLPTLEMRVHPYPGILALGISLLEIELDHPIEHYRPLDSPNNGGGGFCIDADRSVARKMLELCNGHSPYDFMDAVDACITADTFSDMVFEEGISFENEQFLYKIYELIVARLEAALRKVFNEPISRLDELIANEEVVETSQLLYAVQVHPHVHATALSPSEQQNTIQGLANEGSGADEWLRELHDRVTTPLVSSMASQARIASKQIFPDLEDGPLKIAILDTGIALPEDGEAAYGSRVKDRKSWLNYPAASTFHADDTDGHGTHAAGVLLKVAPTSQIFVAQVFRNRAEAEVTRTDSVVHKRIAEAITYAVKIWKVNIISMSFGFDVSVEIIEEAIELAARHKIIMIAAASNCGGNGTVSWPARHKDVLCIYATDHRGNPCSFTPTATPDRYSFSFLGEAVRSYWPAHLEPKDVGTTTKSGTSTATAIAAGVAALFLEYIRYALDKWDHKLSEEQVRVFNKIRTTDGMKKAFKRMALRKRLGYDYVAPWEFFCRRYANPEMTICNTVLDDMFEL
ncbi:subtilisin-like protein [Mollisia scopiformis]|uniref:Subtilisin-like protein n=1 Tax=Mollisia scopiformis TaxID=149040 RepID=A0A194X6H8_MOLSC|nr:subtilisin-like protein [Mollisia scopiformis]KUJ15791.1 subtilisin-like protein [Mollisia scopiformis]